MATGGGAFTLQLQRFVDRAKANAELVVRKAGIEIYSQVVLKSPVDTGRFRANWLIGIGAVGTTTEATDKSGSSTIARGTQQILQVQLGQSIWISNSLPYARRLEYGYSRQAPTGMVRTTIAEWNRFLEQAARGMA